MNIFKSLFSFLCAIKCHHFNISTLWRVRWKCFRIIVSWKQSAFLLSSHQILNPLFSVLSCSTLPLCLSPCCVTHTTVWMLCSLQLNRCSLDISREHAAAVVLLTHCFLRAGWRPNRTSPFTVRYHRVSHLFKSSSKAMFSTRHTSKESRSEAAVSLFSLSGNFLKPSGPSCSLAEPILAQTFQDKVSAPRRCASAD